MYLIGTEQHILTNVENVCSNFWSLFSSDFISNIFNGYQFNQVISSLSSLEVDVELKLLYKLKVFDMVPRLKPGLPQFT